MYDRYFKNGRVPWIKTLDLNNSEIFETDECVTDAALAETSLRIYPTGSVAVAMYGGFNQIGRTGLLRVSAAVNQAITAIQPYPKELSSEYLLQVLNYRVRYWRRVASSSRKDPNITGIDVQNFPVLHPTLVTEQQQIADALSDGDRLISALEKLIAKKQVIKLATMQRLLNGTVRLPGFSDKWRNCSLSQLGTFAKGRGIKKDEVSDEGLPCVRYGEIYTQYENYTSRLLSRIPVAAAASARSISKGDLLFAGSGETAEEIGKCVAYLGDEEAYAGGDIVVFTPAAEDSLFLGHLLNHDTVVAQKSRFGQGDAVVHISASNLGRLELYLPEPNEQRAIAAVLSDMNSEIAALERRRDKLKAIKQGMMQALLTGRIRLVKPGAQE
jgi:type I restriction enzyme, S subunit